MFALSATNDWDIYQMDIVTAFLHMAINEEVYIEILEGFDIDYPPANLSASFKKLSMV